MSAAESEAKVPTKEPARELKEDKVVMHLADGRIFKGYLCVEAEQDLSDLVAGNGAGSREVLSIRLTDDSVMSIPLRDLKSVFFVKSFRGDARRKGLRFYSNGPAVGGIWAEVQFKDNEVIEGTIENSLRTLTGQGFFLHPSDSESNNLLIYVNKSEIANFRALGIREYQGKN
jgi:hypothetical protein